MSPISKYDDPKNQPLPFMFILKEGPEYDKNLLDCSLCLLQMKAESYAASSSKFVISPKDKFDSRIGA